MSVGRAASAQGSAVRWPCGRGRCSRAGRAALRWLQNVGMTLRPRIHAAIISDAALPHRLEKRAPGTFLKTARNAVRTAFKKVPERHRGTKTPQAAVGYVLVQLYNYRKGKWILRVQGALSL